MNDDIIGVWYSLLESHVGMRGETLDEKSLEAKVEMVKNDNVDILHPQEDDVMMQISAPRLVDLISKSENKDILEKELKEVAMEYFWQGYYSQT